jgi:hypothetical protein
VRSIPYIAHRILRVLDTQSELPPLICILPPSVLLLEEESALSDGNPYLLIVELSAEEMQEPEQMLP